MGEALLELEQVLRSKPNGLTIAEAGLLQTCVLKSAREYLFGCLVGGSVTWAGTWKLNKFIRLNLSTGAAAVFGLWRFSRSLDACADHILSLHGSRIQKELETIVVTKYRNHPRTMQHISKNFYCERVFDDSTMDQPKIRWRYRNSFSDSFSDEVADAQTTHENDPKSNLQGNSHHNSSNRDADSHQSQSYGDPDDKGNAIELKPVLNKAATESTADPLDCIFGSLTREEEIQQPSLSSTLPKSQSRSRRYHRRHRRHNRTTRTRVEHV